VGFACIWRTFVATATDIKIIGQRRIRCMAIYSEEQISVVSFALETSFTTTLTTTLISSLSAFLVVQSLRADLSLVNVGIIKRETKVAKLERRQNESASKKINY
jgi:hypothetical protein